jgi:hypothetical protein
MCALGKGSHSRGEAGRDTRAMGRSGRPMAAIHLRDVLGAVRMARAAMVKVGGDELTVTKAPPPTR